MRFPRLSSFTLIYPFFLAVAPVLCSYATDTAATQPPEVLLWPLFISTASCLAVTALSRKLLGNGEKAAVLTATVFLFIFIPLYISLCAAFAELAGAKSAVVTSYPFVLAAGLLILAAGTCAALSNAAPRVSRWLSVLSFYFFVMQLVATVLAFYASVHALDRVSWNGTICGEQFRPTPPGVLPNFYYIVIDGYANQETLRDRFGYDNADFRKQIGGMGFRVIGNTFSNYAMTQLSLCSSLNMDYLDDAPRAVGNDSTNLGILYWSIQRNRILRILSRHGYRYVNVGSTFGPTAWNFFAHDNIACNPPDMFAINLWKQTTLGWIEGYCKGDFTADLYRRTLHDQLDNLRAASELRGPKFVFAHVLLPHPPFVFTETGESSDVRLLNFAWPSFDAGKIRYIEQAKYTEKAVSAVLEQLCRGCTGNDIIVVQSDHGPAFDMNPGEDCNAFRYHRMRIFVAVKAPAGIVLPDELSPVNTFRLLLNETLGYSFPLLENRAFLSTYGKPYQFTEITHLYRKGGESKK